MLAPAQTLRADSRLTTGVIASKRDGCVELAIAGSDYRLLLAVSAPISAEEGQKVQGVIRAQARRIDVIPAGGRFISPVLGRPCRVQGRVIELREDENAIVVRAAAPITLLLGANQRVNQFAVGQLVATDVEAGATLTLQD